MLQTSLTDLLNLLKSAKLRVRTGLWLMLPARLGGEPDDAARLGLVSVDCTRVLLESVGEGERYLALTAADVFTLVDQISHRGLGRDCYLVYNFDLLVAALSFADRAMLWEYIFDGLPHRPHALLFTMPQGADHLLPPALTHWQAAGRAVEF